MRKKLRSVKHKLAQHRERIEQLPKHPYALPVSIFLCAFILSAVAFVWFNSRTVQSSDSRIVHLYMDGKKQTLPTRAATVGDMLKRLDVTLGEHDVVEPAADAAITDDDFNINVYRAQPVTVIDQGNKAVVGFSAQKAPNEIAKQVGVTIFPEDRVKVELPDDVVKEGIIGAKVVIDRATPANLNLYGTPVVVRTHAHTVKELLDEKNVRLAEGDSVQPAGETPLTPQIQVFVTRSGTQIASVEETIPMPVEMVEDASLSFGSQAVRQRGAHGKKLVTYQIELVNGREVSRKRIQETTIQDPVKQIIARGPAGSFGQALAKLRSCEGAYTSNTNNGYYGAYQFNLSTWKSNAPPGFENIRPDLTDPVIQDQAATNLYKRRGWQPWPACSIKLGLQDIYR
jgi:uncharacterized protein YabE (DUF348 family)